MVSYEPFSFSSYVQPVHINQPHLKKTWINMYCLYPVGNIWVYSVYPPSYTPGEAKYCDRTTYQFAFVVLTVTWIILGLVIVCGCCFSILTCCNIFSVRQQLTASRNSFYGSTSFEGPAAGDIWFQQVLMSWQHPAALLRMLLIKLFMHIFF